MVYFDALNMSILSIYHWAHIDILDTRRPGVSFGILCKRVDPDVLLTIVRTETKSGLLKPTTRSTASLL